MNVLGGSRHICLLLGRLLVATREWHLVLNQQSGAMHASQHHLGIALGSLGSFEKPLQTEILGRRQAWPVKLFESHLPFVFPAIRPVSQNETLWLEGTEREGKIFNSGLWSSPVNQVLIMHYFILPNNCPSISISQTELQQGSVNLQQKLVEWKLTPGLV